MSDGSLADRLNLRDKRNDPTEKALSNCSPWLHYGQIAAQRCALDAKRIKPRHSAAVDSFLEELIVRRELADNVSTHVFLRGLRFRTTSELGLIALVSFATTIRRTILSTRTSTTGACRPCRRMRATSAR